MGGIHLTKNVVYQDTIIKEDTQANQFFETCRQLRVTTFSLYFKFFVVVFDLISSFLSPYYQLLPEFQGISCSAYEIAL